MAELQSAAALASAHASADAYAYAICTYYARHANTCGNTPIADGISLLILSSLTVLAC